MRVFVTGGTGLIGRRVVVDRLARGDVVTVLSRDPGRARQIFAADANPNVVVVEGTPAAPGDWQRVVDGCDAVVHLAGAGIADRRWTAAYRRRIEDSRLDSTYQVARAILDARRPPRVLVSASAVGIYGDTGDRVVDETAAAAPGALADLAVRWEAQAARAREGGSRVVLLRIAPVLDERGGLLGRMVPIFRLGLGGPWGPGDQYVAWVHYRDLVAIIGRAFADEALDGAVNATAPEPVTARVFAKTLARVLRRPALVPAPTPLLRLALGPMARHLAESARVVPARLRARRYAFVHPQLEPALRSLLETTAPTTPAASAVTVPGSVREDGSSPSRVAVRLLAVGVDGTMLRSNGQLPRGVVDACRAAERAGCVVVPASTRAPRGLATIARELGITGPVIAANGAVIWNPRDDRPQHHQPLERAVVEDVVREVRHAHPEVLIALESIDSWYTDRLNQAFEDGPVFEPDQIGPLDHFYDRPITRLELAGPAATMASVRELLRRRFWEARRVSLFVTDAGVVQVMHPLVDKSIALQRIAAKLGVDRDAVLAIGDAENDQGMIEWAGLGVAVANARPGVKRLADEIVPSNDELGVARAIQKYVL